MFVVLNVLGNKIKALVDCGATRSFISSIGLELARKYNLKTEIKDGTVQVANGEVMLVTHTIFLPVELKQKTGILPIRVLGSSPIPLILGLDFLKSFDVSIDFRSRSWLYNNEPKVSYTFETVEPDLDLCNGLRELTVSQSNRLQEFLTKELPKTPEKPGLTDVTEHKIEVTCQVPIKQRHYMVSPKVMEAITEEVDAMLADDIIEPSKSSWSSPIVMIRKPDSTYRFCLDFRKLNQVTKKDAYPLPQMESILSKLRRAKYITKIDLHKGFLQVPLNQSSKEYTAFIVPGRGLFHFKRMPFGLTNSPATFQRMMDGLIGPEMEPFVFTYLDDIIIVTDTFEEHLEWLSKVIKVITNANLRINSEKSEFCTSEVRYLGFLVNEKGLQVDPEK